MVRGDCKFRDLRCVAKPAVGDDAGSATDHQTRDEDAASGCRTRILAAVDHHHRARGAFLDRLALRMSAILEHGNWIEILPRRYVAQREGFTDHVAEISVERVNVLDELIAQSAFVQRRAQGSGAYGL